MTTTIWICVTSLVERVISEAVEKRSNSVLEKLSTLVKIYLRRLRANPAAVLDDRKLTATVQAPDSRDSSSISAPVWIM